MTPSMQKVVATKRRIARTRRLVTWLGGFAIVGYLALGLVAIHENHTESLMTVMLVAGFTYYLVRK